MATIATRLTNTGTLLVNGSFDEVSFNPNSGVIINTFTTTETFSGWTPINTSVIVNNTVSPAGTLTASKLVEDNKNAIHRIITNQTFAPNVTYTMSTYAKAAERRNFVIFHESGATANRAGVQANLQTGTISNYTTGSGTVVNSFISNVDSGWYRFGFTFTGTVAESPTITFRLIDNAGNFTYTGDGTSGLYIWGAQFEQGPNVTTYVGKGVSTILTPNFAIKNVPDTVYSTNQFDEITFTSGFAKRETQTGNLFVTGSFDEFTGAPVVDSSLKCWLDAGQTASYSGTGNIWTDLSGNNNTGTLTSSPGFDSIAGGGSLTFNGTSFVSLAANLVPTGSRSITIAFQSSNVSTRVGLISNRDSSGWFCCLNRNGNSNINYDHATSGGIEGITASNVITALNTWYISTMTYNVSTGNASIYLNGNLVAGPTTISPIVPVATNQSFIGKEVNSSTNLLGKVGDVIVYNRALSSDEVAQNFNALRRRYNI
jgi:hypothetical protein